MSFGLNRAEVIGRLGADVTISNLTSGGRVANLSIATDEGYLDRQSGQRIDKTEWHRVVSFQSGLIDMLEKHAKKGRLVYVAGKMQTRKWRKEGEDSDRFSTEILLVPGSRIQFLDKPAGGQRQRRPGAGRRGDVARQYRAGRHEFDVLERAPPSRSPPGADHAFLPRVVGPFLVNSPAIHRRAGRQGWRFARRPAVPAPAREREGPGPGVSREASGEVLPMLSIPASGPGSAGSPSRPRRASRPRRVSRPRSAP